MVKRQIHWLDEIGQELWDEVHADADTSRHVIQDEVPLGTVSLLPEEQLTKYLGMTPEALGQLQKQVGPAEFQEYVDSMQGIMDDKLGPLSKLFKVSHVDSAEEIVSTEEVV